MQMQAADTTEREPYLDVLIELIDVSPTNPRRFYDELAMEALTTSVRLRGVIQPVLLRPSPQDGTRFELVFGTRRLAASKRAERTTIPAVIKELTDLEVAELQVVENSQREDVHAIEEGEAFAAMRVAGASVAQIAEKIQQSTSHVYGRLRLAGLAPEVKEAAFRGVLDTAILLVLARLPPDLQVKAATEIAQHGADSDEPWSFRDSMDWLDDEFLVRVDQVPWDPEDVSLNPPAPACSSCPSRGANVEGLPKRFANVCTDVDCAEGKEQAYVDKRLIAARARGIQVLTKDEAAKVFPVNSWQSLGGDWIRATDMTCDFAEPRTWSKALAEAGLLPDALAMDPRSGVFVELLKRKGLEALKKQLARAGVKLRPALPPPSRPKNLPAAPERKPTPGEENKEKLGAVILERLAKAVHDSPGLDLCALRAIVRDRDEYANGLLLLTGAPHQAPAAGKKNVHLEDVTLHKMDERELLGLAVVNIASDFIEDFVDHDHALPRYVAELLGAYKVNPVAIKAELAAPKAAAKADKGNAKASGKAKAAAKADKGNAKASGKAKAAAKAAPANKSKSKTTPNKKR